HGSGGEEQGKEQGAGGGPGASGPEGRSAARRRHGGGRVGSYRGSDEDLLWPFFLPLPLFQASLGVPPTSRDVAGSSPRPAISDPKVERKVWARGRVNGALGFLGVVVTPTA